MLHDLSRGAGFVLRGFELILRPGLRRYVAIPAALNVLLFLGLTALTAVYFDGLMARLIPDWAGLIALLALLWLIPVTTLSTPFLWLVLSAWMLALEYLDHPLELDALPFRAKRAWMRERRWLCLGFGFATLGATLIPIVNFLVMPAAVAGGTALWADQSGRPG